MAETTTLNHDLHTLLPLSMKLPWQLKRVVLVERGTTRNSKECKNQNQQAKDENPVKEDTGPGPAFSNKVI